MGELINVSQNQKIADHVETAHSLAARIIGLLGRSSMPENNALWINHCSSIHTWFMKFPIDIIFVDKHLKVVKTFENIEPFKLVWPVFGARSVFELPAGRLQRSHRPNKGDQLHVRA